MGKVTKPAANATPATDEPAGDAIIGLGEGSATVPDDNESVEGGKKAGELGLETVEPVSSLTPTKHPVRNAYGLELDRFGLPVNGPARVAVLATMDVADPAIEPGDWDFRDGDRAAAVMEKIYG